MAANRSFGSVIFRIKLNDIISKFQLCLFFYMKSPNGSKQNVWRKKTRRKSYMNPESSFKRILVATSHKTQAVRPLITHVKIHPSKRTLFRRGLEFHLCTLNKNVHTKKVWKLIVCTSSICQCWLTIKNLH